MPKQRAGDGPRPKRSPVYTTFVIQAFWDEEQPLGDSESQIIAVAAPEEYIDEKLQAIGRQQEIAGRLRGQRIGRTFCEVGLWSRSWTRGDDDDLRWLGSKQEVQTIDAWRPSSVVD